MAEKMKVAVVRELEKPLEIEQLDVPYAPSGQVLVRWSLSGYATPACTRRKAWLPAEFNCVLPGG